MTNGKKDILIIMGRYLPGYKDGGPVRSMKNLVDNLGKEYNFKILTCDRDHEDTTVYPNIKVHDWNQVGDALVYYVPPRGFTLGIIKRLAAQVDLVYCCGCFNDYAIHTLILKRLNQIKVPVVVAAMGLFSPMEFRLKYKKKKLFTVVFNTLGIFKKIYWSLTSLMEFEEIRKQITIDDNFFIAEDLPRVVDPVLIHKDKQPGKLKIVWISRIAPKKNLKGAIEILSKITGEIEFAIYGSQHVIKYWEECETELKKLPSNISWSWHGSVDSEKVVETLKPYHVFLFPSLGENYGHVIQEALSAGCAVVLSDQTPWKNLEQEGVGYVYSIDDKQSYIQAIERYVAMKSNEFQLVSEQAIGYAVKNSNDKKQNTGYRNIFNMRGRGE